MTLLLACTDPIRSEKLGDGPVGCVEGATQTCVGAGACSGGQVCLADGSWGACDCGDTAVDSGGDTGTDPGGETGDSTPVDTDTDTGTPPPTELDLHDVVLFDNPPDLADWPITTEITLLEFGDDVHVEFSKQYGDDRWPDITPPDWDGPLQYTLGLAEYIDGQWYGSAAIQFWYDLYGNGGNVALDNQVAVNWYYDSRWGELQGRQPATGETIGVFVIAGNVRGVTDGSQSPVWERSNVVLVPFPDVSGATWTF